MRPITVSVGPLTAPSATNIRTASGVLAAGTVTLNGSLVSGGVATLDTQRQVLFTTTADETTKTLVLTGTNLSGDAIGETVTLVNNTTVASVLSYKTFNPPTVSAALTGNLSIGTNGIADSPWVYMDPWAFGPVSVGVTVSGTVNFDIEVSYDDPNDPSQPVAAGLMAWFNCADSGLVNKTGNVSGSLTSVPRYARLFLNSQTNPGYATATFIQPGVVPK